jgi:tetratricopeptide (TPR) repeat protein
LIQCKQLFALPGFPGAGFLVWCFCARAEEISSHMPDIPRIEKTVFLSYRRTNAPWALAISQNLTGQGFDVFFDFNGIASGDFESIILGNIRARAHFIVLLTPSALERCSNPDDWLRREIEAALELKRNIVPLMLEGFNFSTQTIASQLTGKLATLKSYGALPVPVEYFDEAMDRLRSKYLNVALDTVLHPVSSTVRQAARVEQAAASAAPTVTQDALSAQEWFERGFNAEDREEKLYYYNQAIRLKPDFADAYNNRGLLLKQAGDVDGAIADHTKAIELNPEHGLAYYNRGISRDDKGDLDGAIEDYTRAARLRPQDPDVYYNRGISRKSKGDIDGAIADYAEAIRLNGDYANAYNNRGLALREKGDTEAAIRDYNEAIRSRPDDALAYYNRGIARDARGDRDGAIEDYTKAIRRNPDYTNAYYNRGISRKAQGDVNGALEDYTEAIRTSPDHANAYYNRAQIWKQRERTAAAIADYQKYLDVGGGERDGDTEKVEEMIRDLQKKL